MAPKTTQRKDPVTRKFRRSPTVRTVETKIGRKHEDWVGNCFGIAQLLVEKGLTPGGIAVYGHYTGFIHKKSYFGSRAHFGWCNHGWVLLPDGTVVDPTRWVFENVAPYIYVGPATDYDEGSNKLREIMMYPPPGHDPDAVSVELDFSEFDEATECVNHVWSLLRRNDLLGEDTSCVISRHEAHWLGNVPYAQFYSRECGMDLAPNIFKALSKVKMRASIPIDNYRRAKRIGAELGVHLD